MSNLLKDAEKEIRKYNGMLRDLNRADGQKRPLADPKIPMKILKNEEYIPIPDIREESPYLPTDLLADFTNGEIRAPRSTPKETLRSETDEKKLIRLIRNMNELDKAAVAARYEYAIASRTRAMIDEKYNFIKDPIMDSRKLAKEISALKRAQISAIRMEEEDNRRLEEALRMTNVPEYERRRYLQLTELLKKEMEYRDAFNRTLVYFYESEEMMKIYERVKRDATALAKRTASEVYRFRCKVRTRQTALILLDQKTTEIALLEQAKYMKRHVTKVGLKAREAVERDIARMEANILVINGELDSVFRARNVVTQYDTDSAVLPNGAGSYRASCIKEEEKARFHTVTNMAKIVREIGQIRNEKGLCGTWDNKVPFGKRLNDYPVKF